MSKDFEKELNAIITEFKDEVGNKLTNITNEVAKETVDELKQTSPKHSGEYAKSWKITEGQTDSKRITKIIHNGKHYRRTHLLEWGHAKVNGGRVGARPHIAIAEKNAINKFEQKLKEGIER